MRRNRFLALLTIFALTFSLQAQSLCGSSKMPDPVSSKIPAYVGEQSESIELLPQDPAATSAPSSQPPNQTRKKGRNRQANYGFGGPVTKTLVFVGIAIGVIIVIGVISAKNTR